MMISKLMSRSVSTCKARDSLHEAARQMWDQDIGCLPVLDDESHVIGIVTDRDACMAAYTQGRSLEEISVDSAMAHQVYSCLPTDPISEVEAVMKARQVRRMPVIDEQGHLVGIVSMNDIVREADRELAARHPDIPPKEVVSTLASICQPRHVTLAAE